MRKAQALKPIRLLLTMLLALSFCAASVIVQGQKEIKPVKENRMSSSPEALACTITIYRDTYGVPHVFGQTDASTVFGFAYAQAEDNFWRVEENFIHALGRASELYGEKSLDEARRNRALEIPRLALEG